MKSTKIITTSLLFCALLVIVNCVSALDENITVIDEVDDVIDLEGNIVTDDPDINVGNIDISQVKLIASGKDVTIELKVKNIIEDRGSLEDFELMGDDLNIDAVGYTIALITDKGDYTITYVNGSCSLVIIDNFGNDSNETITDFTVVGNTLTINFEVLNANEQYDTVSALSQYMKFDLEDISGYDLDAITVLIDEVTDQPLSVVIFEFNDGTVDNPINFSALASGGTPSYSFRWDFGDGTTTTDRKPTHAYSEAGEYSVNLTVTDNDGSVAYDEVDISILDAGDNNNGNNNGDSPDITIFFAVIAIIAVVGVIIVIYIIRR